MKPQAFGHCFISREDWPEYCRICADTPVGSDYDAYLKDLQELCHGLAREGRLVVKIDVKPADLLAWCKARRLEVNSKSRAEYAADRMREIHQKR
jgi:hypothetical protein